MKEQLEFLIGMGINEEKAKDIITRIALETSEFIWQNGKSSNGTITDWVEKQLTN